MKRITFTLMLLSVFISADCYDKNSLKTFNLFEKAFKH